MPKYVSGFWSRKLFGRNNTLYFVVSCLTYCNDFDVLVAVWLAGLVAVIAVAILGVFCVLSVFQLAMVMSRERVVMSYSVAVIAKLALVLLASKYSFCYVLFF